MCECRIVGIRHEADCNFATNTAINCSWLSESEPKKKEFWIIAKSIISLLCLPFWAIQMNVDRIGEACARVFAFKVAKPDWVCARVGKHWCMGSAVGRATQANKNRRRKNGWKRSAFQEKEKKMKHTVNHMKSRTTTNFSSNPPMPCITYSCSTCQFLPASYKMKYRMRNTNICVVNCNKT